jgi:hypothetical protein
MCIAALVRVSERSLKRRIEVTVDPAWVYESQALEQGDQISSAMKLGAFLGVAGVVVLSFLSESILVFVLSFGLGFHWALVRHHNN